jgi:nucleotide-binding universal stress UspA family protein
MTVLCAVDLGDQADEAIRQAADAALAWGTGLVVYHALPAVPSSPLELASLRMRDLDGPRRVAREILDAKIARRAAPAPVRVEVETVTVPVHAAIVERAEALDARLVVLGHRATSRLHHLLLGSVAERVVRDARGPVLVVRVSYRRAPIVVAIDFSESSAWALREAADEARRRDVALVAVHVVPALADIADLAADPAGTLPVPETARPSAHETVRARLEDMVARAGVSAEVVVTDGPAVSAIVQVARQHEAGLVVVGATGHSGLLRALLGSVAEGVARRAPCSVLVVRSGEHERATWRSPLPHAGISP